MRRGDNIHRFLNITMITICLSIGLYYLSIGGDYSSLLKYKKYNCVVDRIDKNKCDLLNQCYLYHIDLHFLNGQIKVFYEENIQCDNVECDEDIENKFTEGETLACWSNLKKIIYEEPDIYTKKIYMATAILFLLLIFILPCMLNMYFEHLEDKRLRQIIMSHATPAD